MNRKIDFNILESLRGLAALYVCIAHCRGILWIGGEHYLQLHPKDTLGFSDYLVLGLNMLTRLSTEFVIIFFVLSGFSIAHSLRHKQDALPFYKRRFIRLYPPYIAAILWAMVAYVVIKNVLPNFVDGTYDTPAFNRMKETEKLFSGESIMKSLVYLPPLGGFLQPFWSLIMEVIFYLLAPFLFKNKVRYYIVSIVLFSIAVAAKLFIWQLPDTIALFCFYSIFFAFGVALYDNFGWIQKQFGSLIVKTTIPVTIILFFGMIAISLLGWKTLNAFLAAGMSILLVAYLLTKNLQINWLFKVGRYSYTLYITHFPTIFLYLVAFYLITGQEPPYIYNSLVFIPCIFICLAVAYGHYYLVEKRSKEMLDRLRLKERNELKAEAVAAP